MSSVEVFREFGCTIYDQRIPRLPSSPEYRASSKHTDRERYVWKTQVTSSGEAWVDDFVICHGQFSLLTNNSKHPNDDDISLPPITPNTSSPLAKHHTQTNQHYHHHHHHHHHAPAPAALSTSRIRLQNHPHQPARPHPRAIPALGARPARRLCPPERRVAGTSPYHTIP